MFMVIKKFRRLIIIGFLVALLALMVGFLYGVKLISDEVDAECKVAIEEYGGDCTNALLAKLSDGSLSMSEFNRVVWTLGQHGDERALAELKVLYESETIPIKYELEKTMKLLDGGFNITKIFWKN